MVKIRICWSWKKLITKFFKNSNLDIKMKTENSVGKILTNNKNINPRII